MTSLPTLTALRERCEKDKTMTLPSQGAVEKALDPSRIEELLSEYGGYDPTIKLGLVYGTCTVGEFLAAIRAAAARDEWRPTIESTDSDPMRKRFTCDRHDSKETPGLVLYIARLDGRELQLYRNEAEALWLNIGRALCSLPSPPKE